MRIRVILATPTSGKTTLVEQLGSANCIDADKIHFEACVNLAIDEVAMFAAYEKQHHDHSKTEFGFEQEFKRVLASKLNNVKYVFCFEPNQCDWILSVLENNEKDFTVEIFCRDFSAYHEEYLKRKADGKGSLRPVLTEMMHISALGYYYHKYSNNRNIPIKYLRAGEYLADVFKV